MLPTSHHTFTREWQVDTDGQSTGDVHVAGDGTSRLDCDDIQWTLSECHDQVKCVSTSVRQCVDVLYHVK